MDFAKFASLISSRELIAPSAAALAIADPFEGTVNQSTFDHFTAEIARQLHAAGKDGFRRIRWMYKGRWMGFPVAGSPGQTLYSALRWLKGGTYISCWHGSEIESEAMWRLYSSGPSHGVAVRTTTSRLSAALPNLPPPQPVRYIDYPTAAPFADFLTAPFAFKRDAFRHEHEWRIIVHDLPSGGRDEDGYDTFATEATLDGVKAMPFQVPLQQIFTTVRLSPFAPEWMMETCQAILKAFDTGLQIEPSSLFLKPFDPDTMATAAEPRRLPLE